MTQRDGMGREEDSGWGTRVYLWQIHFDICLNQYNIVKLKNKIKLKKKKALMNLGSVLKSRNITLSTMIHIVKAMGFSVVI